MSVQAAARGAFTGRLGIRPLSTPQRLRMLLALVVGLTVAMVVTAGAAVLERQAATRHAAEVTEPSVVAAQALYTALSDADTTAAGGLLAGPSEPAGKRAQYQQDLAIAGSKVAFDGTLVDRGTPAADALQTLAVGVPFYAGLVERAVVNNRLSYPVASAYLNEASAYLRGSLLPAATSLYATQSAALEADRSDSSVAWPVLLAGLLVLLLAVLLAYVHRWVRDRFHRRFTVGVAVALLAVLTAGAWAVVAISMQTREAMGGERDAEALLSTASQARLLALQAHADDELTLLTQESVASYQSDYLVTWRTLRPLASALGSAAVLQGLSDVQKAHSDVRQQVYDANYTTAIDHANGQGGDLPAASGRLDTALAGFVSRAQQQFDDAAQGAQQDLTGLVAGVALLGLIVVLGTWAGLAPRWAEYR